MTRWEKQQKLVGEITAMVAAHFSTYETGHLIGSRIIPRFNEGVDVFDVVEFVVIQVAKQKKRNRPSGGRSGP